MTQRAVSTVEELDALPARSLVVDLSEECWRKLHNGRWDCLDTNGDHPSEESGTLLWQGGGGPSARVVWEPASMHEGTGDA